jgi:hypothetical protein
MASALELEAEAQRLSLAGERDGARSAFLGAAEHYRRSWELASASSYGRLVGMLKAAILGGRGEEEARYVRAQLGRAPAASATAAYALALAALVEGDDHEAARCAAVMRGDSDAFARAADAIGALADRDRERYAGALTAIVRDFEQRSQHLTGVAIADTALMLERLAERRGMCARVASPLLPVS